MNEQDVVGDLLASYWSFLQFTFNRFEPIQNTYIIHWLKVSINSHIATQPKMNLATLRQHDLQTSAWCPCYAKILNLC